MSALEQRLHISKFPISAAHFGAGRTTLWYYFAYIWSKFPVQFPFEQFWILITSFKAILLSDEAE